MFCKTCGAELREGQNVCTKCGVKAGTGKGFCKFCGAKIMHEEAVICVTCGSMLEEAPICQTNNMTNETAKTDTNTLAGQSKGVILIMAFLFGSIGVHNFMMGEKKRGIVKILTTFLCCGIVGPILAFVDFLKIAFNNYTVKTS